MKKILLIEDNTDVRENTAEILELANYEVKVAENGKIGVELATHFLPDLIICDIMMPEMDGYGVLHVLSKHPKTSTIPFIFLTAKAERSDLRKGMDMGADDYITKPFDDIELLNAIESRLKKNDVFRTEFANTVAGVNHFFRDALSNTKVDISKTEYDIHFYKKKQIVYSVDKRPFFLYFVVSGRIKTFKINDEGKEFTTSIYKEGEFMGYTALLENSVYVDSAEALEDSEVMLIPKTEFEAVISRDNTVAAKFIKILAQNLIEKEEQLLQLAYNSLRKRVATGLLHVHERFKDTATDNPILEISREELAQVVGTAKESLIRILSDFKSEKLIDITEGKITVLQDKKLRELYN